MLTIKPLSPPKKNNKIEHPKRIIASVKSNNELYNKPKEKALQPSLYTRQNKMKEGNTLSVRMQMSSCITSVWFPTVCYLFRDNMEAN